MFASRLLENGVPEILRFVPDRVFAPRLVDQLYILEPRYWYAVDVLCLRTNAASIYSS